jgi:hypothetical protein
LRGEIAERCFGTWVVDSGFDDDPALVRVAKIVHAADVSS